jgi:hypothetical protein
MIITNSGLARRVAGVGVLTCAALLATACGSPASSSAASPSVAVARTSVRTFLAEGQDLNGRALYRPACRSGCVLSGDGTAILDKMTWSTWSASRAVGTGIYQLDGCNPDCAAGPIYKVPVVVTFSQPVKACSSAGIRWFWSRASFRFPHGLPKALRGDNAPLNPWTFSTLIAAARHSCA